MNSQARTPRTPHTGSRQHQSDVPFLAKNGTVQRRRASTLGENGAGYNIMQRFTGYSPFLEDRGGCPELVPGIAH